MDVEERWFDGFKGAPNPGSTDATQFDNLEKIREKWDLVESKIQSILDEISDGDLEITYHENIKNWHVLSHVVNHGTAHRAQIGAMMRGFGLKPPPQDYIFYVLGRL
jgi:uncharacterized damage-inducible protein DinB